MRQVDSEAAAGHCWTLLLSLDVSLRALAPFMPYLSEHLHQRLPLYSGLRNELDFPQVSKFLFERRQLHEFYERTLVCMHLPYVVYYITTDPFFLIFFSI